MPAPKGRFIVLDGTDGSGKTTQIALLARRLRLAKRKVLIVDFPQYSKTLFGELLDRARHGEFGPMPKLNPYFLSLAFAGDRWQSAPQIRRALQRGKVVLANRYTSANLIHQGAKFATASERNYFRSWLRRLEFEVYGIPEPDLTLFLDVPPVVTARLMRGRARQGRRQDSADRDRPHQLASYRQALRLAAAERAWRRIACTAQGAILPVETIADRVWRAVQPLTRR